jgi:hypothetical protein
MPVTPDPNYVVTTVLTPGQICQNCNKPLARHTNNDLGQLICTDMPPDSNRPNWEGHGLRDTHGRPYRSLKSQLDQLRDALDQNGLVSTYDQALELIQIFVARMSQLPVEAVLPPDQWFVPGSRKGKP